MRVRKRYFSSPSGLTFHVWPWSKAEALEIGRSLYVTEGYRCPSCQTLHPMTYVSDDSCFHCFGLTLNDPRDACHNGRHERIIDNKGRCVVCDEAKRRYTWRDFQRRAMVPYHCPKCDTNTLFVVETGQCLGCLGVTPPIAPEGMTRRQAGAGGFRLYRGVSCARGHNGVRYVSSGTCLMCQNDPGGEYFPPLTTTQPVAVGMDRAMAGSLNFKLYDTGQPCRYGHRAARYVSSGQCVECAIAMRRRRQGRTA